MNGWKKIAFSVTLNLAVIATVFRVKMLRDFVLGKAAPVGMLNTQINSAQELKIATVGTLNTKGRSTQGELIQDTAFRRSVPMPHFPRM